MNLAAEQQAWQQLLAQPTNPAGIYESKDSWISSSIHMGDDKLDEFEVNFLTVFGISDIFSVIVY